MVILNLQTSFSFCLCGHGARFRCDWKKSDDALCRKPLCEKHAKEVASGKHLCPFHQLQYESWKRRHPEKVAGVETGIQSSLFEGAAS
jgi:hypothetical protein